jgi:CheY-like chemotaxis protein/anti-sigma regulatory factor (Ser/Thr protein kinase)
VTRCFRLDDTRPQVRTMSAYDVLRRAYLNNSRLAVDFRFQLKEGRSRLQFVADERWVDRILNNLIANAIRHSQGTKIFLGARRRGGDIVLEVRDNGRGLKPEALARVFEPLSAPSSIPGAGHSAASSGLGLYIVQRFAELMHGTVACRSTPGEGTCFEVRLPGPVTILEDRPKRLDPEIRQAVKNKFVAVLDDDPEVLKSTERLFESLGVRIFTGEDPVRWFHGLSDVHRMPDLFLMDFQLKGQDVELTLQMVKRKWSDKKPRIIVVTGHLNNQALVRISKTVPVLRKPLNAARIDLLLGMLSGQTELPEAGFL